MCKVAEVEQTYQEIKHEYHEKYGGIPLVELDEEGSKLLIQRLEAELNLKELTIDEWRFNRYHKPVLLERINRVQAHIQNHRFLQGKVKQ